MSTLPAIVPQRLRPAGRTAGPTPVHAVGASALPQAARTLAAAFADDPVSRWMLPRTGRLEPAFRLFLERVRVPRGAGWYLPMIGVCPEAQGRGLGSILLDHMLRRCDAERMPAYLEATTPRSRALYERHRFEVTREVRMPRGQADVLADVARAAPGGVSRRDPRRNVESRPWGGSRISGDGGFAASSCRVVV